MRVHTVASLAVVGMGLTSFVTWQVTPPRAGAAVIPEVEGPSIGAVEIEDHSRFAIGETLTLEGRVGHAELAGDRPQSTFVLATIAGAADVGAPAAPLDLAIVIDHSGSMRGAKLTNAIAAARGMVRRMRDGDRLTVIAYSLRAEVLFAPTVIDALSRERAIAALAGIRPRADTCISCGLELAMRFARPSEGRVSRILLLSDGEATAGVQSLPGFQALAQRCRSMGTTVSTVGVDIEYNQRVMSALAQFSNGRHYFAATPSALAPVFEQELESLTRTIAKDVELVVELAPGVQVEQVFDRAVRREGGRLIVPIGTVEPGEEKTFIAEVRVPPGVEVERPIAEMRLRYDDLVRRAVGEHSGRLAVRTGSATSELDPFVAARLSRSRIVAGLREANELAGSGRFAEARQIIEREMSGVRRRRREALSAAPAVARADLEDDFSAQLDALASGGGGFAGLSPSAAAPAERSEVRRRAARQQRANAEAALPLAL